MPENPKNSAQTHQKQQASKFPSYLTASTNELSPRARIICEILEKNHVNDVETALSSAQFQPSTEIVEEVLRFSYGSPSTAVKFFGWAGLAQKHTDRSWNLMVDLLGKNQLFEKMWDAIRTMKQEGVLSVATFVSVFASYCAVGRFNEAIMTFDVMERYKILIFHPKFPLFISSLRIYVALLSWS